MTPTLMLTLQYSMGIVFAAAVIPKLLRRDQFMSSLEIQGILPAQLLRVGSWVLIAFEGGLATLHMVGLWLEWVTAAAVATIALFLVIVATQLAKGKRPACLCFDTSGDERMSQRTIMRLTLLLAAEVLLFVHVTESARPQTIELGFDQQILAFGQSFLAVTLAAWSFQSRALVMLVSRTIPRTTPLAIVPGHLEAS